jgi:hypothetical protein
MLIAHRINTVAELQKVPSHYGIEIDLRDSGHQLILAHDPFSTGERFDDFLRHYRHAFIILNIKSERIEWRVLELLELYQVRAYFLLDCSFPMVVALSRKGEHNIALRYSEFEGLDTIRLMRDHIRWVWVDCFSRTPLTAQTFGEIQEMGLKVCLVSPELQGRHEDVAPHIAYFRQQQIQPHMVCSKIIHLDKWQTLFN